MTILKFGDDCKSFKIIWDDNFYLPFGFGYWTKILRI